LPKPSAYSASKCALLLAGQELRDDVTLAVVDSDAIGAASYFPAQN
jgi:hypothetical protein